MFQDESRRPEKSEARHETFTFKSVCECYLTRADDAALPLRLQVRRMIELQAPDWWHEVPTLSGPTVQVREVEICDTGSLFELLTDSKVARYISTPPPSASAFHGFIEWAHRRREAGICVCFAVVPRGLNQAIGLFQLRALEPSFRIAEWGFALGSAFWSTGIFTEAASLVVDFAFKTIGVHRLEARAVIENSRGNRALEKLGARGEAVLRKSFGKDYSQFLWAIVAEEWRPPMAAAATAFDAAKLKRDIARAIAVTPVAQVVTPSDSAPFPFFLTDAMRPSNED
jgi:[ribosomal protein S5]-alanine N-acetyltransferase